MDKVRIVDSAEPWAIAEKLIETGWERVHLDSGDYWFLTHDMKSIGITRKTTTDLVNSMMLSDNKCHELGRHPFQMQLEEMLDLYDINKILIEGSWAVIMSEDILRKTVQNYLSRWQDKGFRLLLSASNEMTVKILNEQYALYQKPYSLSANTKGFSDDRVLAFPAGCRGRTAWKCLQYFGELSIVAVAEPQELIRVDGIGQKKAKLIYEHFHRRIE